MEKQEFLEKIKKINPDFDQESIGRAFDYAQKIYKDRKRLSGQSLLDHCAEIALSLAEVKLDSLIVIAGLLHEALEKVNVSQKELKKEFGNEIAFLVEGVTNVGRIKHRGIQRSVENLRKLFLATAKDIRVVLIKLINRLHGLKTIWVFNEEKQKRLAIETLEIYAPIAYRLGMRKICGELEDLAFPYAYPKEYQWLMATVKEKYQERENYLKKVQTVLQKKLKKAGLKIIDIHARTKHYYSLYKKLLRYEMDLNKIYDLVALRIIVPNIGDCYAVLGLIHKLWKPLPGRIKDYIAIPKPNGYQSLHTTVFSLDGKIVEIQIRTQKMHEEAEYGIASHWYYSERKGLKEYIKRIFRRTPEKEIVWIKQLQEWQKEKFNSPEEFLESLKIDFFKDRIFVLTPKGDVIDLPDGATPIDFAYHIHTDIGHRCIGAKVDEKLIPLDQPLKSGQVVEIITQKEKKPSQDWLRFVKTTQAKSKIKNWFKKIEQETSIKTFLKEKILARPKIQKEIPQPLKQLNSEIEINGQTKILTHLAGCCQPKLGDEIKGYITVSRGISIHRANCPNLNKIKNPERFISVSWKINN